MSKNYDSLDLGKFIASIVVVALHADALYDISPLLNTMVCNGVARIAVPFFFVTSAFFFFRGELTWDKTKKYCKRLLTLYVAWFIVSIPKTIFDRFYCSPYPFGKALFIFLRSFVVTSTFSGSWFIISCIFCALLFYRLEKLPDPRRKGITIVLSVPVYLWCVFTSAYGNLMEPMKLTSFYDLYFLLFGTPYLSLIVGVPYFAVGRYFAKAGADTLSGLDRKNFAGFLVSFLLLLGEVYLTNTRGLTKSTDCYLMLLPCICFLFPILLDWRVKVEHPRWLRTASTIVFFSQFMLLYVCEFAEWALKITIPCLGKFIFTLSAGLLLTQLLLFLSRKKGFKWVRYFY